MRFFTDGRRAEVTVPLQVRAFRRPYAPYHDRYQRYYAESLRLYCSTIDADFRTKVMSRFPRVVRALKRVRDGGYAERLRIPQLEPVIDAVANVLEGPADTPSGYFDNATGQTTRIAETTSRKTTMTIKGLPTAAGVFIKVELSAIGGSNESWHNPVQGYFRFIDGGWKLVGFERLM